MAVNVFKKYLASSVCAGKHEGGSYRSLAPTHQEAAHGQTRQRCDVDVEMRRRRLPPPGLHSAGL